MRAALLAVGIACTTMALAGCASSGARPVASGTAAQPTARTVSLKAGFVPDPYRVVVTAGGANEASTRASICRGYIATTPDLTVNYTAGNSDYLYIHVSSKADTTLVVRGPSGGYFCNDDDDVLDTLDPWVTIKAPRSGAYQIWVGTVTRDTYPDAALYVTEVDSSF